jgi:hypothetical protein
LLQVLEGLLLLLLQLLPLLAWAQAMQIQSYRWLDLLTAGAELGFDSAGAALPQSSSAVLWLEVAAFAVCSVSCMLLVAWEHAESS